ncbi:hypothetical protein BT63DRAFT_461525 [Microthyrium microscopicum]|uniref:C2H2-type domain-containing protein n=1 Tax=Microthyrium microscopicum TaxID=703497 RepID=A0A6A6TVE7_9PEZI|nr:hypothetical protein BT63DRAFT_461525 [Microthyrium microscopicum]
MSKDPSLDLLLRAARSHDEPTDLCLHDILEQELVSIATSLPEWQNTQCLLQDLGNFLTRTSTLLSTLAERVVHGQDIHRYAESKIKEMNEENDFSDLGDLEYMQEKHLSLNVQTTRSISQTLLNTTANLNAQWRTSRMPHFKPPPRGRQLSGDSDMTVKSDSASITGSITSDLAPLYHTSPPLHNTLPPIHMMPPSTLEPAVQPPILRSPLAPGLLHHNNMMQPPLPPPPPPPRPMPPELRSPSVDESQPDAAVHHLLKNLVQRGTGRHTCPFGLNCTKGGVRAGKEILFERNSAFRAHLQKHEKMFRCELAGCTARGGFARIDQLRRHQNTVSHTGTSQV